MMILGFNEIELIAQRGKKVYWKNRYAWIAKHSNSKWWNPFDWYKVKIDIDK